MRLVILSLSLYCYLSITVIVLAHKQTHYITFLDLVFKQLLDVAIVIALSMNIV